VEQLKSRQYDEIHTDKIVPRGTIKRISDNVFDNCSTWNNYRIIFKTLIFGGFLQAIIGIIQFFSQSSIGITFLQESVFSAQEAGIAKIILLGSQIVRPYGLLPHPNLLAFFLGITILITVAYPLLFRKKLFHVEQFTWAYRGIIFVQVFCFLVTFSKSAYLGLLLSLSLLFSKLFHVEQLVYKIENVPRGTILSRIWRAIQQCSTWNKSTSSILKNTIMFHVEHYLWVGACIFMIILVFIFGRGLDWQYFIVQPLNERLFLFQEIILILKDKPVTGVGIGQSVLLMQDFFPEKLEVWQFQPIHNLFLLIGSELGITGLLFLVIFVYFMGRTLFSKKYVPRGTYARFRHWFLNTCSTWNITETFLIIKYKKMFHVEHFSNARDTYFLQSLLQSLFLFLGVVAFFDHYLWDIQQGQLLFWLLMAIFARFSIIRTIDK
jgi:O-antigen ligase